MAECLGFCVDDPVKSDIWAVGITIVWMAMGSIPWRSNNHEDLVNTIQDGQYILSLRLDPAITQIVQHMLVIDPKGRSFPTDERLSKLCPGTDPLTPQMRQQRGQAAAAAAAALPCQAFRQPHQRFLSTTQVETSTKLDIGSKRSSVALGSAAVMMLPKMGGNARNLKSPRQVALTPAGGVPLRREATGFAPVATFQ